MKIIDPVNENISTISNQIIKMKNYIQNSLKYFDNLHINKNIDYILKNGTEHDVQIQVFEDLGIAGLKQYLMDSVDYN